MLIWSFVQYLFSIIIWFPALLFLILILRRIFVWAKDSENTERDFAVIVTAYQQTDFLKGVVDSILKSNYNPDRYLIYVVADNCDISDLHFEDEKVVLLRPEQVLAGNIKSHLYAIERFKRPHEVLTIIDSDNLVDRNYLKIINQFFNRGFKVVQGVRKARNLNTNYACLDEASDIYYRFVDRFLLFGGGSSATMAGSGMAFNSNLYGNAIKNINISGAGFDKMLQYELVRNGQRLAFAENAVVLDGKTTNSDQLVKQRARWISAWGKSWVLGWKLLANGIATLNWNKIAFSQVLTRPPLFIMLFVIAFFMAVDIFIQPAMLVYWIICLTVFVFTFFAALIYFKAQPEIFRSLVQIPKFIFLQVLALFKAKNANKISVATKHEITK